MKLSSSATTAVPDTAHDYLNVSVPSHLVGPDPLPLTLTKRSTAARSRAASISPFAPAS